MPRIIELDFWIPGWDWRFFIRTCQWNSSIILRAKSQTCTSISETKFSVFLFLVLESKICKLPQLWEVKCIKVCAFMNFYGSVKNQSQMKMVFTLVQSSPTWWSRAVLWRLAVHGVNVELLSNTQECIPLLAHRNPSHCIFHVYPSSSIRFQPSIQAVPGANPCAGAGPYFLNEPVH